MTSPMLRVGAIQHNIVWEDRDATLRLLAPQIARAAGSGAELLVLTEMFATGFSMSTDKTAEADDGPIVTWMCQQAVDHNIWISGSAAIRSEADARPVNRHYLVGPDGVQARYDKIHPFSYAGEHERFAAGAQPVIATVNGVRLGLTTCYDLRFANLYWQLAGEVDAYLVIANWPASRSEHWRALLVARAIENQAYVVGVNRVGRGGKLEYDGSSQIIDPMGRVIASAFHDETLLMATVDVARVAETRDTFPFANDRRDDFSPGN